MIARLFRGKDPVPGVVAIVSLLAVAPLLDGRFATSDAARRELAILVAFDGAFRDGALWPRWAADALAGSGYPLFTVLPPLPYLIAEAFVLAGLGVVGALKAALALAVVASAVAMALLGGRLYGPAAGLVAGVVFGYLPVRLGAMLERAALADLVALVWLPLVLWSLLGLEGGDRWSLGARWASAPAIGLAGVAIGGAVLSAPVLAGLFAPVIVAFAAWRLFERRARGEVITPMVGRLGGAFALAAGLSMIWWLPLVAELPALMQTWPATTVGAASGELVHPVQLLAPYPDARSGVATEPVLGLQLGIVALGLGGFALVGSPLAVPRRARRAALVFALMTGGLAALATPLVAPVWALVPRAPLLVTPWHILLVAMVPLAALAGGAVAGLEERFGDPLAALRAVVPLLVAAVLASWMLLRIEASPLAADAASPRLVAETAVVPATVERGSALLDQVRRGESPQRWRLADPLAGRIEQTRASGASSEARVRLPTGGRVIFETTDYPGWTVRVDGRVVDHLRLPPAGVIAVDVPPGDHVVSARFESTLIRLLAGAVSILSLALAVGLLVVRRRHGS